VRAITRVALSCLAASAALFAASAPASAAPKRFTGKLSKPGYTVIALAANGKARSVRVRRHTFRLRPPAKRVTLHLRAPDGTYSGPIVVGRRRKGRVAVVGVRAGARLGRIRVLRGHARPSRALRRKWIDASRLARARRGVPIGARRFGLVRSRPSRGASRDDPDLDGIANPLDIDDDGDLVLDNLERSIGSRSLAMPPQAGASAVENRLGLQPVLPLGIEQTTNANAAALTPAQSDARLVEMGYLIIGIIPGDSAELDCGGANQKPPRPEGLSYCTLGGTGSIFPSEGPGTPPWGGPEFPECCDGDGDGFGALVPGAGGGFFLHHGATTAQIQSGDVLIEHVGGAAYPETLQYVFATVPALVSYSDSAGNSAPVQYPVHGPFPTPADAGLGASGNGFPVAAGSDGHIRLTLTFWRPQRWSEPPGAAQGQWIDIGGLTYSLEFFGTALWCGPQAAYSTSDPSLTPAPPDVPGLDRSGQPGGGFTDSQRPPGEPLDRPANAANRLTFTVDLTQCLESRGLAFNPGDELPLGLRAIAGDGPDQASQTFWIKRR
jgi:hypothetical protein